MKHWAWAALALSIAHPAAAETLLKPEVPKPIEAKVEKFFTDLKTGDIDRAYINLFGEGFAKEQAQAITNLANQNGGALKLYGGINGWELLSEDQVSPDYVVVKYELRLDRLPLFYTFTFYKKSDSANWAVVKSLFGDSEFLAKTADKQP